MKNNKSPCLDGFSVKVFKFFGLILGHFHDQFIMATGSLSITQKFTKIE